MTRLLKSMVLAGAAAALLGLAVLFAAGAWGVVQIVGEVQKTRAAVQQQLSRLAAVADGLPDRLLPPVTAIVDRHATRIEHAATLQISAYRETLDSKLGEGITTLHEDVQDGLKILDSRAQQAAGSIEGLRGDIHPLLAHGVSLAAQVDEAAPLFLDCDHNPDCAFNRFQGSSKAFERTMKAFATAAPRFADAAVTNDENLAGITGDVHTLTSRLAAPRSWFGRIWEVMKLLAVAGLHFL